MIIVIEAYYKKNGRDFQLSLTTCVAIIRFDGSFTSANLFLSSSMYSRNHYLWYRHSWLFVHHLPYRQRLYNIKIKWRMDTYMHYHYTLQSSTHGQTESLPHPWIHTYTYIHDPKYLQTLIFSVMIMMFQSHNSKPIELYKIQKSLGLDSIFQCIYALM